MKTKRRRTLILIIVLLFLAAGAAGGTLYHLARSQSPAVSETDQANGTGAASEGSESTAGTETAPDGQVPGGQADADGQAAGGSTNGGSANGGQTDGQALYADELQANGLPKGVKDAGICVYIETGHGREDDGDWDAGCSWSDGTTEYEEATLVLPIAKAMVHYLRRAGVRVDTDADQDNSLDLEETLDHLDQHTEYAAFINIHCDWAEAVSGTMPLYYTDEQRVLAEKLNAGVHSELDIADRGCVYRDDLETLTNEKVHCPAVLFETGSIKADNELLRTEYDRYGKGLAKGLCDYLEVPFPGGSDPD